MALVFEDYLLTDHEDWAPVSVAKVTETEYDVQTGCASYETVNPVAYVVKGARYNDVHTEAVWDTLGYYPADAPPAGPPAEPVVTDEPPVE